MRDLYQISIGFIQSLAFFELAVAVGVDMHSCNMRSVKMPQLQGLAPQRFQCRPAACKVVRCQHKAPVHKHQPARLHSADRPSRSCTVLHAVRADVEEKQVRLQLPCTGVFGSTLQMFRKGGSASFEQYCDCYRFVRAQADSSILTRISEISKSVDAAHAELMTSHANSGESLLEDPINDLQGKVFRAVDVLQKGLLERETEVRDRRRLRCWCLRGARVLCHHGTGRRVGSSASKRGYCCGTATS